MFSPSLAMTGATSLITGPCGSFSQASLAASPAFSISVTTWSISWTKSGVRATKSDSQFTSASTPHE